jgi:hypothetical protein
MTFRRTNRPDELAHLAKITSDGSMMGIVKIIKKDGIEIVGFVESFNVGGTEQAGGFYGGATIVTIDSRSVDVDYLDIESVANAWAEYKEPFIAAGIVTITPPPATH